MTRSAWAFRDDQRIVTRLVKLRAAPRLCKIDAAEGFGERVPPAAGAWRRGSNRAWRLRHCAQPKIDARSAAQRGAKSAKGATLHQAVTLRTMLCTREQPSLTRSRASPLA